MDTVKYNLGDIVYLKVKSEDAGMVTGILFRPRCVRYIIAWGSRDDTTHYDIELTNQKAFVGQTA
jgi:hypothetical protein